MLTTLRTGLGLGPTLLLPVPLPVIRLAARIGDRTRRGALSTETLGMLLRGNAGSAAVVAEVLGRPPRAVDQLISPQSAPALRLQAIWSWLRPLLVVSIALMWILAGWVSWVYAHGYGLSLLQGLASTGR